MLPGKTYTPEELLRIIRRRIWLLLVPFAVVSAGTALWARRLPNLYRSETVIQVVPQRVPEAYVKSAVTTPIEERLQAINQSILSRTRLEQIIQDFDLYADARRNGIMEDVVEGMRKDVGVDPVRGDAFRVSYVGLDPHLVMKVTEKLAQLFIDESLQDRSALADGTSEFLEAQLEDARRNLVDQERKLEAYRVKYSGQLPSQENSNLQAIHNVQMQIQSTLESINHDRNERLLIEKQLADLTAPSAADQTGSATPPKIDAAAPATTATQRLAAAKDALAALKLQGRTEDHPDVKSIERLIRDLQKQADAEALAQPVSAGAASLSPAERKRQSQITALQAELEQIDQRLAAEQTEETRLRKVASDYQQRLDAVPARESEMVDLTRDYGTLQSLYTNLLAKKEESAISANLERRQIGEQFKVLDRAILPERPFSPNRQRINLIGMAVGVMFGLALVALLEYRDTSFNTDDEITSLLALPVLAVVPLMRSQVDRQRATRLKWVLGLGLGGSVAACLAVVVYSFVR
jgi:polysaccharide chain length determinant protein (PEP-CTERM system associated)